MFEETLRNLFSKKETFKKFFRIMKILINYPQVFNHMMNFIYNHPDMATRKLYTKKSSEFSLNYG